MMVSRRVDDSLVAEMVRMGCASETEADGESVHKPELDPLPPHTNDWNRNIVTLKKVVDTLGVVYTGGGVVEGHHNFHVVSLPGQSLDVHRMVSMGSDAMLHMRDGFRGLWAKSFDSHMCYRVDRLSGVVSRLNH
jgi:hypothetical protein